MTTVAELYQQLLGRAPDQGGLDYWTKQFGNSVDPNELAAFTAAAAPELASRNAVTPTAVPTYTGSDAAYNPIVDRVKAAEYSPASGMPTSVSDFYQKFYGDANTDPAGKAYWQSQFGGDQINPQQASILINEAGKANPNASTGMTVEDAFKTYLGNNTDQAGINFWKQQFGNGPINVGQLAQLTNTQSGINTDTGPKGVLGTGIGPNLSVSDAVKLAALYYGGSAAMEALGAGGTAAGSTGTGLTVGAGNTGLGLTLPEATTGLGMTAPSAAGLAAGSSAATDLATAAGIGTGIGTLSPYATGTGSLLAGTGLADIGAGAIGAGVGAGLGAGAGAAAGTGLGTALGLGALASGVGGILNANAAKDAAATQAAAANAATQSQMDMFNKINAQQAPYRAAGYNALNQLGGLGSGQYQMYDANGNPTGMGTGSGYLQHQFDATDLAKGLAPNYDFMLQQGQMANQRAANVAGGGLGGNALQGLNKFTQDYAGNAYQNAFQNYQTQRNNIYNTLAGIAGIGQTGQTATNTAAQNATNAATQLGIGSAAAQAAGTVGSTNAYTGALNNAVNNYTLASLLNQGGRVAG